MTPHDFQLWMSLYAATGVCCAIATLLSATRVAFQLVRERIWVTAIGARAWVLLGPRIWWRWQKTYLLTAPVTLGIVAAFAFTLSWGA